MEVCTIAGVLVICIIALVMLLNEHDDDDDNSGPMAQIQHKFDCLEIVLTGKHD